MRRTTLDEHRQCIVRVLLHVQSRLDGDLSLHALARVAHVSPHHFQRVFASLAGESAAQLVRRLRLERAARHLRDGDETVRAISVRAGYGDPSTFCRAFRARFGRWPQEWRHRLRRRPRLEARALPESVRTWVNRPLADFQLRSVPVPASAAPPDAIAPVRLLALLPLRVAFVRRAGASASRDARRDLERLAEFASRRGGGDELMFLRVRHDDDAITPRALRRVDLAVVVGPRRRGEGDIGVQTVGGGAHAVATVEGGRGALDRARRLLEQRAPSLLGAVRRDGPVIEIGLEDPRSVNASSHAALTDVLVPVTAPTAPAGWYWRRRRPVDSPGAGTLEGVAS